MNCYDNLGRCPYPWLRGVRTCEKLLARHGRVCFPSCMLGSCMHAPPANTDDLSLLRVPSAVYVSPPPALCAVRIPGRSFVRGIPLCA